MTKSQMKELEGMLYYWDMRATDEEELRQINLDAGDFVNADEADRREREAVTAFNAIVDVLHVLGHGVKFVDGVPRVCR